MKLAIAPKVLHAIALAVCVCTSSAALASAAPPKPGGGVAWVDAGSVAAVKSALTVASNADKPVLLYWGASWCPPCNQVKATLFNRADFAALSKSFVMVNVDGDKPGAQQVAQQYKVRGYPSMLVLGPRGEELTRLPGEVDPERYLATMQLALTSSTPVARLAQTAAKGGTLTDAQWQQLAWYAWDIDEQQLQGSESLPSLLEGLAAAAPQGAVKDRLRLRAIVASAQDPKLSVAPAWVSASRAQLLEILASPARAASLNELWVGYGEALAKALAPNAGAERAALIAALDKPLAAYIASNNISRSDLMDAWASRMTLAKLEGASAKQASLGAAASAAAQQTVAASTDRYERQALVPAAAYVLAQAGDDAAADALLTAELPRAVAPYYHMLVLGSNAKKRKDFATALVWYEKAWVQSQGAATRAQWGSGYVNQLVDMAPLKSKQLEVAASKVLTEAIKGDLFYARTQRSVQRMASKVQNWAAGEADRALVAKRLDAVAQKQCKSLNGQADAQKACESLRFSPI